jgi:nitrous oxidase accessory protein NosD
VVAAAAVLGFQSAASAHSSSTVYVSANGAGSGNCHHPDAATIQQGVTQAPAGATVIVCPGTYKESVNITTPRLTLHGLRGAVVDATGQSYGIGIGADRVTVTGMTVHNAAKNLVDPADAQPTCGNPGNPLCAGIVTVVAGVPGNHLVITDNELTGNIGFGLDVVSTFDSRIKENDASSNGVVGINVVDDVPGIPVRHNQIIGNRASDNASGCGIALASHTGAGVIDNVVLDNRADRNGLPAGGAGVLLATPVPNGQVRLNKLVGNSVNGNGHSGIQVHFHAPTATVDGNSIVDNRIGQNNVRGDVTAADPDTTGILIGSNSPLNIVVRGNSISHDVVGIFVAGPTVTLRAQGNTFRDVQIPIKTGGVFL